MNVSGGNSKEISELFTNKLVFSESVSQRWSCRSWLTISSLDAPLERSASLLIMIIMKEFLFSISFILLSSNLKLSIDIFIMSVRHVFAEFLFIFVKRSCSRRDGRKHIMFVFFILYKHNVLLILWVHTNKSRPFTVLNDVLVLLLWTKMMAYPLKKMQVIALAPPCPAKRALASTLHTNYWIQCTFI